MPDLGQDFSRVNRTRGLVRALASPGFWWVLGLVFAGLLAWAGRNAMNPDGLSYLEMASRANEYGPSELINRYWSPGYPAVVSLALRLFHPSPESEFAVVHALNWAIFVLAMGAFAFFLKEFLAHVCAGGSKLEAVRASLVPFGYSVFLFFVLWFIGLGLVSPDLLLAAVGFLLAGIGCRLLGPGKLSWAPYLALGTALALGYYVKSVMFPLGMILVVLLWLNLSGVRRWRLLATLAMFLTLSAPLIAVVSRRAGHLTISDVGALNYLWYTNRRDLLKDGWAWNGVFGSARSILAHPPRILWSSPRVLEFGEPVPGTYPIWYEPAYWWTGAHLRFDPWQQLASIRFSLHSLAGIVAPVSALPIGALVLLFLRRRTAQPRNLAAVRVVLWWPVAACAGYSLLWIERRYIGGWLVLFWLGAFGHLVPRTRFTAGRAVLAALTWVLLAITAGGVAVSATQAAEFMAANSVPNEHLIAARLRSLGIGAGARLAMAGVDFGPFYAHIAGARVVAQIEDADAFWRLDRPARQELQVRLARAGITAIVARESPPGAVREGWVEVPQSGTRPFSILPLVERR